MNLETVPYTQYEDGLPQSGKHILAQTQGKNIIVYQAFNPHIAEFAVREQRFGGAHYRFSRMSWIKPNFLWMMYRAGWAMKEHQQRILAISIPYERFLEILEQAVHSSFKENVYPSRDHWKQAVQNSEVRLQWDPDHDPHGTKLSRRAIQLGLRGAILKDFATNWIVSIEDITPFVHEQKALLAARDKDAFRVIKEQVLEIKDIQLKSKLGLDDT